MERCKVLVVVLLLSWLCAGCVLALRTPSGEECSLATADDAVDVYLLEGLVSMFDGSWIAKELHLFHGGIGFHNRETGKECQCEFYAVPAFITALLPIVNLTANTLDWENHATVACEPFINRTQWRDGEVTKVAETSGKVFNSFLEFNPVYAKEHPWYYLMSVRHVMSEQVILPCDTCFDYVSAGWKALADMGVEFDPSVEFKREDVTLYVNGDPVPASYDDPKQRTKMVQFYDTFQFGGGKSVWQELVEIFELFPEDKFAYQQEKYYKISPEFPFILPHYHREPMPGQKL